MAVGHAHNHLKDAVERTVPSGFLTQSPVICWYALHGYDSTDIDVRRVAEPWYQQERAELRRQAPRASLLSPFDPETPFRRGPISGAGPVVAEVGEVVLQRSAGVVAG